MLMPGTLVSAISAPNAYGLQIVERARSAFLKEGRSRLESVLLGIVKVQETAKTARSAVTTSSVRRAPMIKSVPTLQVIPARAESVRLPSAKPSKIAKRSTRHV